MIREVRGVIGEEAIERQGLPSAGPSGGVGRKTCGIGHCNGSRVAGQTRAAGGSAGGLARARAPSVSTRSLVEHDTHASVGFFSFEGGKEQKTRLNRGHLRRRRGRHTRPRTLFGQRELGSRCYVYPSAIRIRTNGRGESEHVYALLLPRGRATAPRPMCLPPQAATVQAIQFPFTDPPTAADCSAMPGGARAPTLPACTCRRTRTSTAHFALPTHEDHEDGGACAVLQATHPHAEAGANQTKPTRHTWSSSESRLISNQSFIPTSSTLNPP